MSLRFLAGFDDAPSGGFSQRSDTMSLNILEPHREPKSAREYRKGYDPLSTADIAGASPRQQFSYDEKSLAQVHGAIEGASPRVLHPRRDHPNFSLLSADIDGAVPASSTFSSARVVDPNNPVYKLPSYEKVSPEKPRLLRETFPKHADGDDDGVGKPKRRWRPAGMSSERESSSLRTKDVPGGYAGWRSERLEKFASGYAASRGDNNVDGGDAGATANGSTSSLLRAADPALRKRAGPVRGEASKGCTLHSAERTTNPLEPVYEMTNRDGQIVVHGHVEGSSAKPARGPRNNAPDFSLSTRDVNRGQTLMARTGRRQRRMPNYTADIEGAKPGHAMRPCKKVPPEVLFEDRATPEAFTRAKEHSDAYTASHSPGREATTNGRRRGFGKRSTEHARRAREKITSNGDTGAPPVWWPKDDANDPHVPPYMAAAGGSPRAVSPEPDAVDIFSATWSGGRPIGLGSIGEQATAGKKKSTGAKSVKSSTSARSTARSVARSTGGASQASAGRRGSRQSGSRADADEIAQVRALP